MFRVGIRDVLPFLSFPLLLTSHARLLPSPLGFHHALDFLNEKLALQRALLEQLLAARAGLREEQGRREQADALCAKYAHR